MLDELPSGQTPPFAVGGGVLTCCTVKACDVVTRYWCLTASSQISCKYVAIYLFLQQQIYMHSKAAPYHAQPCRFVQQFKCNWHGQQGRRVTDLLRLQLAQDVDGCVGGQPP